VTQKPKFMVLGIDGATFDLVDAWAAEGRLPNLARLMREGARGPLESTVIPNSFPGWTSCTTGVNPAKHGIFNALIRKRLHEYRMTVVNARDIRYERIWQTLSREGKRVGVLNVPCSYPPVEVNGFLIGGMLSPSVDSDFTHPPGLMREIIAETGDYVIDLQSKRIPRDQMRDELLHSVDRRGDAIDYLLRTRDLDFGFFVFTETDRAQHYFWADMDPSHPAHTPERGERFGDVIRRVYERVDVQIGRILERVGTETQVFVVSDHGFGSQPYNVYINRYLADRGFLKLTRSESLGDELRESAKGVLDRVGLLDVARRSKRLVLGDPEAVALASDLKDGQLATKRSNIDRIIDGVDWSRTVAYALVPRGVRINLKGREPGGIVDPSRYDQVRDEVIASLETLTFPDGERVFDRVFKREDVMSGPYLELAPDIVTSMRVGVPACHLEPKEVFSVNTGATGSHTDWGVLIAWGPGIAAGTPAPPAQLQDITPTALYALGVPIYDDMDGRPLTELFSDEFRSAREIRTRPNTSSEAGDRVDPYSADEEDEIYDRLKGLGYMN
jgi:predicted AlkP superfamily phosphohydrolase/phosphomutase